MWIFSGDFELLGPYRGGGGCGLRSQNYHDFELYVSLRNIEKIWEIRKTILKSPIKSKKSKNVKKSKRLKKNPNYFQKYPKKSIKKKPFFEKMSKKVKKNPKIWNFFKKVKKNTFGSKICNFSKYTFLAVKKKMLSS